MTGVDSRIRQRVGVERAIDGWRVVVKVNASTVAYDRVYGGPLAAQAAAEELAARLRDLWARLGIRVVVRTWEHRHFPGEQARAS